jgi:hypothetical protein
MLAPSLRSIPDTLKQSFILKPPQLLHGDKPLKGVSRGRGRRDLGLHSRRTGGSEYQCVKARPAAEPLAAPERALRENLSRIRHNRLPQVTFVDRAQLSPAARRSLLSQQKTLRRRSNPRSRATHAPSVHELTVGTFHPGLNRTLGIQLHFMCLRQLGNFP